MDFSRLRETVERLLSYNRKLYAVSFGHAVPAVQSGAPNNAFVFVVEEVENFVGNKKSLSFYSVADFMGMSSTLHNFPGRSCPKIFLSNSKRCNTINNGQMDFPKT